MRDDVGCPVCGSLDFSCGTATSTTGVDERTEEAPAMADLQEYRVTVNGHDTIMNLTEADAARLGGTPVQDPPEEKRADAHTKARTARNKSDT